MPFYPSQSQWRNVAIPPLGENTAPFKPSFENLRTKYGTENWKPKNKKVAEKYLTEQNLFYINIIMNSLNKKCFKTPSKSLGPKNVYKFQTENPNKKY